MSTLYTSRRPDERCLIFSVTGQAVNRNLARAEVRLPRHLIELVGNDVYTQLRGRD